MSASELVGAHERLFGVLADHAPVGVFVGDDEHGCVYANELLCELAGLTREQALGGGWEQAVHPDDVESVRATWAEAAAGGRFLAEFRFLRADGGVRWVQGTGTPVLDGTGRRLGWVGCCVDVTARRESDERYRDLFDHANDTIFASTVDGVITSINSAGEELTGYTRDELVGMNALDLIAPEDAARASDKWRRRLAGRATGLAEYQMVTKRGDRVFVEVSGRLLEKNGEPVGVEAIVRDTSERHALEEKLRREALHDQLTGLPNRTLFHDRLSQALARRERTNGTVAVMLLDLDEFKLVNDSLGHGVGDELLVRLAPRLRRALRAGDSVARLGGDEFGFLLEDVAGRDELATLAERLLAAIAEPLPVDRALLRVNGSVGITVARPADTAETVLSNADTAMYKAKRGGKGCYRIYNDAMRSRLLRELAMTEALTDAVYDGRDLDVHYQPIVSLTDGRILALEALARWNHPRWGWVAPAEFIPIAEEHGLIVPLGELVVDAVAQQTAAWRTAFPGSLPLGISVNSSTHELSQAGFVESMARRLERHGASPADIGIDITERALINRNERTLASNLDRLTELGVRLSLDDFGTGYSSMAALKYLPLAALKIDRSFIQAIGTRTGSAPISSASIGLGHALGLTVIAEGVETRRQAGQLHRLGCDAAQGFYFARPQPADEVTALLEAERAGHVRWRTAA